MTELRLYSKKRNRMQPIQIFYKDDKERKSILDLLAKSKTVSPHMVSEVKADNLILISLPPGNRYSLQYAFNIGFNISKILIRHYDCTPF